MGRILTKKAVGSAPVMERLAAMDKTLRHAVLATSSGGRPYASLMAFALAPDGRGVLVATPKDSRKYRNIAKNKNVALLIDTRTNSASDFSRAEAVTVIGRAVPLRRGKKRYEMERVFLKKHPELKAFLGDPGTALVLVNITECRHVKEFQRVYGP